MATLRDYFVNETNEYFTKLNAVLVRLEASRGDPNEFVRLAKGLRGSAQLARENRVLRAGICLEAAARALVSGALEWSGDVGGRARRTIEDLQALVTGGENDDAADARVKRVVDRWKELNVHPPSDALEGSATPAAERSAASRQFREFAAHEVAGIVAEIDAGLSQLATDPRNRDILKAILRRQRALLGAARLDEINIVAETLRAIEDLVRVIVKLNVPVKEEWANVFRAARDVLTNAIEPLKQGNDPTPTPALSKLRTLRTELLDRFGEGEAVPVTGGPPAPAAIAGVAAPANAAAAPPPPPTPAASPPPPPPSTTVAQPSSPAPAPPPMSAPPTPSNDGIVPIEQLCYSGESALRRALELAPQFEELAGDNSTARENVEELFDLIRLGIG
jgi:chemotaxis protein histidine kinase CheA